MRRGTPRSSPADGRAKSVEADVDAPAEHRGGDIDLMTEEHGRDVAQRIANDASYGAVTAPIAIATSAGAPTSEALTVPAMVTSAKPKASNHTWVL